MTTPTNPAASPAPKPTKFVGAAPALVVLAPAAPALVLLPPVTPAPVLPAAPAPVSVAPAPVALASVTSSPCLLKMLASAVYTLPKKSLASLGTAFKKSAAGVPPDCATAAIEASSCATELASAVLVAKSDSRESAAGCVTMAEA